MDVDATIQQARKISDEGRQGEAIQLFEQVKEERPTEAHLGIGVALMRQNRYREAGDQLTECGIDVAELHVNAAAAYEKCGDEEKEVAALMRVLKTRQRSYEAPYRKLAQIASDKKNWALAYEALHLLFEINSEDFTVCTMLGGACKELRRLKQAVTYYLKSHEMAENEDQRTQIHMILAGLYKDVGEQQKAYHHFNESYKRAPHPNSLSNLIMTAQYTHGVTLRDFYALCREYSARFLQHLPQHQFPPSRLDPAKAKEGLRIGFVSGDFVAHSLSHLMLEAFKQFREVAPQHTIVIYMNRPEDAYDDYVEVYKSAVHLWRSVAGVEDEEAAQMIYDDQIDVLIDLAGHTAYNRLPVFGYKPAPVQAGWISGMMTPPALATVNYFMTDQWMRPPIADQICSEKLYNLPAAYNYFPLVDGGDIAELPFDKNGYITFGSFNNPCKISPAVLTVWAGCMKAVPGSRLKIKVYTEATEHHIKTFMAKQGVSPDRLEFIKGLPRTEDVMRFYTEQIDIVLDTWPCAGCLTSAEAMWMGAPIVTMIGDTFLYRQTHTINRQIGIEDLSAETDEEYVAAAKRWAEDPERLREFRRTIRPKMDQAPIRDQEALAKGIMDACESFWVDWCESRVGLPELVGAATNG